MIPRYPLEVSSRDCIVLLKKLFQIKREAIASPQIDEREEQRRLERIKNFLESVLDLEEKQYKEHLAEK